MKDPDIKKRFYQIYKGMYANTDPPEYANILYSHYTTSQWFKRNHAAILTGNESHHQVVAFSIGANDMC